MITDPCPGCRGEGLQAKKHEILVKVPAGVEQDTRIRYQGEGEAGKFGGPAGDLYVVLSVKAHKFFERDGDDLHCVMPISFPQAALGTELQIETLEGPATIKIPEGTQSGRAVQAARQGRAAPERAWQGRPDCGDSRGDAVEAEQAAEGTAAAVGRDDAGGEYADQPGAVREDEGYFFVGCFANGESRFRRRGKNEAAIEESVAVYICAAAMAMAAMAAVSARRMRGPRVTGVQAWCGEEGHLFGGPAAFGTDGEGEVVTWAKMRWIPRSE